MQLGRVGSVRAGVGVDSGVFGKRRWRRHGQVDRQPGVCSVGPATEVCGWGARARGTSRAVGAQVLQITLYTRSISPMHRAIALAFLPYSFAAAYSTLSPVTRHLPFPSRVACASQRCFLVYVAPFTPSTARERTSVGSKNAGVKSTDESKRRFSE